MIAVGMRVYWRRHGTPESLYQQDQDFGREREGESKKKAQYERTGASRDGRAAIHLVHLT